MIIGLCGKPSSGKSTFFKAATLAEVEIANYPFTTINKNEGMGYVKVKDAAKEFGKKADPREGYVDGEFRFVPIHLIDVAGLVPGAHKGEGMGSQFLNDLNQADVLIHIIDVSGSVNEKGEAVDPLSYDPANDITFLETELDHWYLAIVKKDWDRFVRKVMQEHQEIHKALGKQLSGVGADEDMVKSVIHQLNLDPTKPSAWTDEHMLSLATELRKRTKPMLIAANKIDVPGAEEKFEALQKQFPDVMIVACSAAAELGLKQATKDGHISYIPGESAFAEKNLPEDKKKIFQQIQEKILTPYKSTGVQAVLNAAVFDLLKYKAIHPGGVSKLEDSEGNVLPDCFLMDEKATALDFAYKLHTDFGKNFIKAVDVRTKMPMAKDHVLKHLDIVEIMAK